MTQLSTADGPAVAPATSVSAESSNDERVRPFSVHVPDAALTDLRRRISATRWTTKELVGDRSQGVQLATMQALQHHWLNDYDWRRCEARINAYPNFITEIDGLDFHFVHVRSKHENALPMIVTHGWPGSVVEQLKIIEPLTDPTAHGATERHLALWLARHRCAGAP